MATAAYQRAWRAARRPLAPERFCPGHLKPCGTPLLSQRPSGTRGRLPERCPDCSRLRSNELTLISVRRGRTPERVGVFRDVTRARTALLLAILEAGGLTEDEAAKWGADRGIEVGHLRGHLQALLDEGSVKPPGPDGKWRSA